MGNGVHHTADGQGPDKGGTHGGGEEDQGQAQGDVEHRHAHRGVAGPEVVEHNMTSSMARKRAGRESKSIVAYLSQSRNTRLGKENEDVKAQSPSL